MRGTQVTLLVAEPKKSASVSRRRGMRKHLLKYIRKEGTPNECHHYTASNLPAATVEAPFLVRIGHRD